MARNIYCVTLGTGVIHTATGDTDDGQAEAPEAKRIRDKECRLQVYYRCEGGPRIWIDKRPGAMYWGGRRLPVNITFADGADLIEQVQNSCPSKRWSRIDICAPDMACSETTLKKFKDKKEWDMCKTNNALLLPSEVYSEQQLSKNTLEKLPACLDHYCNNTEVSRDFMNLSKMPIRVVLHVYEQY